MVLVTMAGMKELHSKDLELEQCLMLLFYNEDRWLVENIKDQRMLWENKDIKIDFNHHSKYTTAFSQQAHKLKTKHYVYVATNVIEETTNLIIAFEKDCTHQVDYGLFFLFYLYPTDATSASSSAWMNGFLFSNWYLSSPCHKEYKIFMPLCGLNSSMVNAKVFMLSTAWCPSKNIRKKHSFITYHRKVNHKNK